MENLSDLSLPAVGVILPAGGKGLRVGGAEPKQFLPLGSRSSGFGKGARGGKPMLLYTIEAFHPLEYVKEIVLVLPLERIAIYTKSLSAYAKVKIVAGGEERFQSVRNGFAALSSDLNLILVHDVARPFVSESVIERCVRAASVSVNTNADVNSRINVNTGSDVNTNSNLNECVIAAMPASDTIKEVADQKISKTLDRRKLILVQTPQVFSRAIFEKIYSSDWEGDIPTDEAQMAERAGYAVKWVLGSEASRKVTGAADVVWAEWMAVRIEAGDSLSEFEN